MGLKDNDAKESTALRSTKVKGKYFLEDLKCRTGSCFHLPRKKAQNLDAQLTSEDLNKFVSYFRASGSVVYACVLGKWFMSRTISLMIKVVSHRARKIFRVSVFTSIISQFIYKLPGFVLCFGVEHSTRLVTFQIKMPFM